MNTTRDTDKSGVAKTALQAPALAPQQAVQEYLDALLHEATTQAQVITPAATEARVKAAPPAAASAVAVEPEAKTVVAPDPKASDAAVEPDLEPETAEAEDTVQHSKAWVNGRPAWAQEKFECLLFKVSGLTLAVPLKELGGVLNMVEDLTPLFGQPDWFLGLLPSKTAGTVKTIDTARWVMPEKYTEAARDNLRYVILMEGTDWGMACHEVAEAITLSPEQVRWRGDRGLRPWLAGTVIEHMCAILDVAALVDLVSEQSATIKAPQWTKQQRGTG